MNVKKKLAEMTDGTVQLLSLVTAGASGAPFKRLKSEETDVFTPEKRETTPDQPRLIALAVTKDGDVEATRVAAKAADIEILEEREIASEDGDVTTLLITKADARVNTMDPEQVQVQLGEELIAICQVEKSFIPFTGTTSFAEAIKSQGFFPQLSNALETFGGVAYQILESANTPGAAASDIQKAGEEFTTLIASMTKALPKETFKMAKELAIKEDETTEETETTETEEVVAEGTEETVEKETEETEATETETETEETVEKEDESADEGEESTEEAEVEKTEETAEETETEEVTEEATSESELSVVLKAIETLAATVAEQGETQAALKEQVEAVAKKAEDAAETADATETAVKGRVSTSSAPDGRSKEEAAPSVGAPPLQDTGMASIRKR